MEYINLILLDINIFVIKIDFPVFRSDGGFWFGKQDCKVLDLKAGDLMIFPGFITHKKQDWETEDGMTHYLEMSFDIPN